MKNLALVLILSVAAQFAVQGQVASIFSALNAGDAAALERFLDDRIELVLENRPSFANKRQAVQSLNQFFNRVGVRSCKEIHQGSSRGRDSKYTIGQLITDDGEYRIFLFIRQNGNQSIIQEIRIDKAG